MGYLAPLDLRCLVGEPFPKVITVFVWDPIIHLITSLPRFLYPLFLLHKDLTRVVSVVDIYVNLFSLFYLLLI